MFLVFNPVNFLIAYYIKFICPCDSYKHNNRDAIPEIVQSRAGPSYWKLN